MTTENWLIVNMILQSSNYLESNSLLKRPIGSRWDKIRHNAIGEKNNRGSNFQIYQLLIVFIYSKSKNSGYRNSDCF